MKVGIVSAKKGKSRRVFEKERKEDKVSISEESQGRRRLKNSKLKNYGRWYGRLGVDLGCVIIHKFMKVIVFEEMAQRTLNFRWD